MYEACFDLAARPFSSAARADWYYPATGIEDAHQTLARCVERAEGVGMLVGPSGTGKTTLCRVLAQQFQHQFEVVLLACGRLSTRRALLQAILFELGQPYRGMDEGELRLALVDHLTVSEDRSPGMLLVVDEAHTLPARLLEEIRMINNLMADGEPSTRLVLAGGAILEERLASPKLEAFNQRIVARCYLESLNREDTRRFIHAQIDMAGGCAETLFPPEACRAVYQATDGVPRLVAQVCDHALLLAYTAGLRQIDRAIVEEAWADLQQLPTPWNADTETLPEQGATIEFGGLDDEPTLSAAQPLAPQAKALPQELPTPQPEVRVVVDQTHPPEDDDVRPREHDYALQEDEVAQRSFPVSGDSVETRTDPSEQVVRIQEALADVDDDFQPAGSIGPQLELSVHPGQDPFEEEFEEEELLIDFNAGQPRSTGLPQLFTMAVEPNELEPNELGPNELGPNELGPVAAAESMGAGQPEMASPSDPVGRPDLSQPPDAVFESDVSQGADVSWESEGVAELAAVFELVDDAEAELDRAVEPACIARPSDPHEPDDPAPVDEPTDTEVLQTQSLDSSSSSTSDSRGAALPVEVLHLPNFSPSATPTEPTPGAAAELPAPKNGHGARHTVPLHDEIASRDLSAKGHHESADARNTPSRQDPIIIVEEGYDDAEPLPLRPVSTVRREHYGQLFAQLRRLNY